MYESDSFAAAAELQRALISNAINPQLGAMNAGYQQSVESYRSQILGSPSSATVFRGYVEVEKATNGYIVRMAIKEGALATTSIANSVEEVNQIIAAAMVSFKLEK